MDTLYSLFKKDEDLRLIENSQGDLFVETSVPITTPDSVTVEDVRDKVKSIVASETVLEDNIMLPLPDIRVQNITFMFAANAGIQFIWVLMIGGFYYWNTVLSTMISVITLSISTSLFCLWYILMIYIRKDFPIFSIIAISIWTLIGGIMLGSISAITHNLAPVQLVLLLFFQCLVIMAYTKLSPRMIETVPAMAFMFVVTLIIWATFIFAFVEEANWMGGLVILGVSFLAILYHGWQIRMSEGRYSLSWDDVRVSIIQFYGDPILYAYTEIIKMMDKCC